MPMPTLIRGRSASRKPNRLVRSPAGFTLIELMVTMAIVGVIFALSLTGLRSAFNVNLKSTAGKMASTLRYLSNKAVTDHMYFRMAYDISGNSYQIEESTDPFVISIEEEESEFKEAAEDKEEEEGLSLTEDEEKKKQKGTAGFAASESSLLKSVKLPSGVLFKDVTVSYLLGKKAEGKVYTYFFPDGYATPTLINLKNDDDDEHYALELFPLSGRVKVIGDYKESLTEEKK